jgi:hypothetical protein
VPQANKPRVVPGSKANILQPAAKAADRVVSVATCSRPFARAKWLMPSYRGNWRNNQSSSATIRPTPEYEPWGSHGHFTPPASSLIGARRETGPTTNGTTKGDHGAPCLPIGWPIIQAKLTTACTKVEAVGIVIRVRYTVTAYKLRKMLFRRNVAAGKRAFDRIAQPPPFPRLPVTRNCYKKNQP